MPSQHRVEQGECINSIADAHGFFPDTLWMHEANSALRDQRKDPSALHVGDVVNIPELREKIVVVQTDRRHTFKHKAMPAVFRVQIFGAAGKAANERWAADVDGVKESGTSGADGVVTIPIAPDAQVVDLLIAGERHVFQLGTIGPTDDAAGVQERLTNLGYGPLELTGKMDDATTTALRAFQTAVGLEATGSLDDKTKAALARLHDTVTDEAPAATAHGGDEPVDERGEESDDGDGDPNQI